MGKRRSHELLILVFIFTRCFLDGCEKYFIRPTAWYYIKSLGQTKEYFAVVLISYNLGTLMTPLVGRISDRFGRVKLLIVITLTLKVLGNILYSINRSAVFPLVGRLVSGMGHSSIGLFYREVALKTPVENRATMFVILEGVYCLGTTFGPAIESFVTFNVNILGWKIDPGNSPGIILTCIWSIFLGWSILLPDAFGRKSEPQKDVLLLEQSSSNNKEYPDDTKNKPRQDEQSSGKWEDFNSKVFCLFYLMFCNEAYSATASFSPPLLGQEILHLRLAHVKLYFLNSTFMNLGIFIATYILLNYIAERKLILVFMAFQIISLSLLASLALTWYHSSDIQHYILLFYVMLGSPYLILSLACSLLSKITDPKNAGVLQGSSLATTYFAVVISRIIMSLVFTQYGMICYSGGLIALWLFGAVWYTQRFRSYPN